MISHPHQKSETLLLQKEKPAMQASSALHRRFILFISNRYD